MSFEELIETLKRIGLASNETKVYLKLLRIGSSKAGRISKETHINRTTTYDALKSLLEKGLVSYVIKSGNKWFEAVNPKRLLEILKEKEDDLQKILPEIQTIYKIPKEKHNVTLFYGNKGIKSVFQDMIKEGKSISVLDSEEQLVRHFPFYVDYFMKQIEKKKIKIRHILRDDPKVKEWFLKAPRKPTTTTKVKFVPLKYKTNSVIDIYGDKVAIIIWSEPPEAVIIKNKSVAEVFRNYFEILWNLQN
ncbi:MAG: hypothetical protein GTN36_01485 [Candidatus Aenigmarchaeota archaeon]|nr:hypothetical protein [Candidatus Aenigmarchaeota archaeon]